MGEFVRVERDEAIATIRLDRPPMNALNAQVQDEIAAAAAEADADPAVRAVVLYGGEKVFAAGADIKEMAEASFAQVAMDSRRLQSAFTAVARIGKPVVAAVTGYALGGGLELALCADFRVAARAPTSASPRSSSASSPGPAAPSGCRGSSGPRGPRPSSSPAASSARRRRSVSAWSTRWYRTPRSTGRRTTWRPSSPVARRWRCARPSRPSTPVSRPTWTPAWRSSG